MLATNAYLAFKVMGQLNRPVACRNSLTCSEDVRYQRPACVPSSINGDVCRVARPCETKHNHSDETSLFAFVDLNMFSKVRQEWRLGLRLRSKQIRESDGMLIKLHDKSIYMYASVIIYC